MSLLGFTESFIIKRKGKDWGTFGGQHPVNSGRNQMIPDS
jgi:hypothetical protein